MDLHKPDPLGMVAPVMLNAKQIMQELWRMKMQWDEPLRRPILQRRHSWKSSLELLTIISVPRFYFLKTRYEGSMLELHHPCDASEVGYGAVSYLRVVYPNGKMECSFILGKSRKTPLKTLSIPRLELLSAVLAARMNTAIRKELEMEVDRVVFWTDSMITLNYIRNETRRFQTYVANRITEIRDKTMLES